MHFKELGARKILRHSTTLVLAESNHRMGDDRSLRQGRGRHNPLEPTEGRLANRCVKFCPCTFSRFCEMKSIVGKITRQGAPKGSRIEVLSAKGITLTSSPSFESMADDPTTWAIIDTLREVAGKHGQTSAQVRIAHSFRNFVYIEPNALLGGNTVATSKGERFQHCLRGAERQSTFGLAGKYDR